MNDSFLDYFKCPERYVRLALTGPLSAAKGFFRFGSDSIQLWSARRQSGEQLCERDVR